MAFVCDVCSKPYPFDGEDYLTLDVVDYKYMQVCSSCSDIRYKLEPISLPDMQVWVKKEGDIKFYPSYHALVADGDTGSGQYGYYSDPGKPIPELIRRYLRGDGTSEEELTSLAEGRDKLYLLWNQVDDYLAHEFKYTTLEDLKKKIQEHTQKYNLPEDAPYVVVTEEKDLIEGHIADYYHHCKWVSSLDDLSHPWNPDLEWKVMKEFLEEEEKRVTAALNKSRQELARIKNLVYII